MDVKNLTKAAYLSGLVSYIEKAIEALSATKVNISGNSSRFVFYDERTKELLKEALKTRLAEINKEVESL